MVAGLDGPYEFGQPVTLGELRAHGEPIRAAHDELRARIEGALYCPFSFYGDRDLRPMQPYLNKLPASVIAAVPALLPRRRSQPRPGRWSDAPPRPPLGSESTTEPQRSPFSSNGIRTASTPPSSNAASPATPTPKTHSPPRSERPTWSLSRHAPMSRTSTSPGATTKPSSSPG